MHYHFYFSTLSVMSFSVQWHLMKYSSVFLHAECSVQSNTYDIFGEFARTKRVVLLSLHEIMKSIPINCSHHRCLLFPLPICHVICHTKSWKQNSLGGGFWTFFSHLHDEITCLVRSATRIICWRSSSMWHRDYSPPCAVGKGWSLSRWYVWASNRWRV